MAFVFQAIANKTTRKESKLENSREELMRFGEILLKSMRIDGPEGRKIPVRYFLDYFCTYANHSGVSEALKSAFIYTTEAVTFVPAPAQLLGYREGVVVGLYNPKMEFVPLGKMAIRELLKNGAKNYDPKTGKEVKNPNAIFIDPKTGFVHMIRLGKQDIKTLNSASVVIGPVSFTNFYKSFGACKYGKWRGQRNIRRSEGLDPEYISPKFFPQEYNKLNEFLKSKEWHGPNGMFHVYPKIR